MASIVGPSFLRFTMFSHKCCLHGVHTAGDTTSKFVKLDLCAPWLQMPLGIDRKHIRLLGSTTIIHRLKAAVKNRRGKRNRINRKILSDGTLGGTIDLVIDGFKVIMANSVSPLMMSADKDQVQWLISQLWSDMKRAESGGPAPSPLVEEEGQDVVVDSDDDDPETAALVEEIAAVKLKKERSVTCD